MSGSSLKKNGFSSVSSPPSGDRDATRQEAATIQERLQEPKQNHFVGRGG